MKENYHKGVARFRIEKANLFLQTARQLFSLGNYNDAVSKSYYCVLSAMRALLALKHQDSQRHSGVIALFHKHYVNEKLFPREFNKTITELQERRVDADYGDFVEITEKEAAVKIQRAEEFLKKAEEVFVKVLVSSKTNNHSNRIKGTT